MRANSIGRLLGLFWRRRLLFFSALGITALSIIALLLYPLTAAIAIMITVILILIHIGKKDLDRPYLGPGRRTVDFADAFGPGRFKEFSFDGKGVPMHPGQDGRLRYFPTFVGWYALSCYAKVEAGDRSMIEPFAAQIEWLEKNAEDHKLGIETASVWYFDFDWKESNAVLNRPWISALGQGAAISALVRASELKIGNEPLRLAEKAATVFFRDAKDGGVAFSEDGFTYLEEYPSRPYSKVLDGFIFAVLAVYDLWKATGKRRYRELFRRCVRTLDHNIQAWDYRHSWSLYGIHGLLCDDDYNKLNSSLLKVMHRLTGRKAFRRYHLAWRADRKGFFGKIGIVIAREAKRFSYVLRNLMSGGNF
jgi:heparosan-N-sulfate-glucuronate 5-epimerase